MLSRSYLDGRDEVLLAVRTEFANRQLRAGQNHRLAQVLEHKAEGRSGIGHRVCAMQDNEAVEAVVVVGDNADEFPPMLQSHIARIDGRVEGIRLNI